jgi:hypothetical protein
MTDVLICGAGAAGLTLAIDLARRDIEFLLIDKAMGPFHGSRGKGLQPRTEEVFEDLGVVDRLAAIGGRYPPIRTYRGGGHVDSPTVRPQTSSDEPYPGGRLVPQFLTEAVLRERLAELGRKPQYRCEVTGFTQERDGVNVHVSTPEGERSIRPTRLFTLCQGPHWTLLGYHVDRGSAPAPRAGLRIHTVGPAGDIIDNDGHFQQAYGLVPGRWVLIRPDGYIGAIVSSTDLAALRDYLDGVGARATGA